MEWPLDAAILFCKDGVPMHVLARFTVMALSCAVLGCAAAPQATSPTPTPANDGTELSFNGVVRARDNACYYDGVCTLDVNGTRVTTMSGRRMGPAPVWGRVEGDPQVGSKVAVYCKRVGDGCTLDGSETYFVRVLP